MNPSILQSAEFDAATLLKDHPPVWRHAFKKAIYDRIQREGVPPRASLRHTRWQCGSLPELCSLSPCRIEERNGFYDYAAVGPDIWHLNFADARLFAAYGSQLMAQDEWQVMEHPVLGSLREWLLHEGHTALTFEYGRATPVLVVNAPRQCAIDLGAPASGNERIGWKRIIASMGLSGASRGTLYGNQFATASLDAVMAATTICQPALLTNIIAIAAPTGSGFYSAHQISGILTAAAGAFSAAARESGTANVEIHTGWWGCGAFGGNKPLMYVLQVLAARISGAGRLVFHLGPEEERSHVQRGREVLDAISSDAELSPVELCQCLADRGFRWGVSDGN